MALGSPLSLFDQYPSVGGCAMASPAATVRSADDAWMHIHLLLSDSYTWTLNDVLIHGSAGYWSVSDDTCKLASKGGAVTVWASEEQSGLGFACTYTAPLTRWEPVRTSNRNGRPFTCQRLWLNCAEGELTPVDWSERLKGFTPSGIKLIEQ